jgi:hypothetical protein
LQTNKPVYPGAFVPVGEPLTDDDLIAALRDQQVQHVIEAIKAPTNNAEKIDAHFREGKCARLWVAAYA